MKTFVNLKTISLSDNLSELHDELAQRIDHKTFLCVGPETIALTPIAHRTFTNPREANSYVMEIDYVNKQTDEPADNVSAPDDNC